MEDNKSAPLENPSPSAEVLIQQTTEVSENPVIETETQEKSSIEIISNELISTGTSEAIQGELHVPDAVNTEGSKEIHEVASTEVTEESQDAAVESMVVGQESFKDEEQPPATEIQAIGTEELEIEENPREPVPEIPQITSQLPKDDDSYTANILKSLNTGGLGLLSAYDSGDDSNASDAESVIEVPTTSSYRNQVIEIDSDDSSSSSEEEECDLQKKRNELEKMIQVDDESEDEEGFKRQPPKVQGELLLEDLPPIEDLHITVPEQDCVELGSVNSVIEQLLLVKTLPGTPLLDIGTILFLEKGQKVLGEVFDVMGQVADPLYCVRFNSNQQIKEKGIKIGDTVYCAPRTEHTQLIILSNLTKLKGSDASWENDIEPPAKYVEYSDDEEEQAARRARRTKNRNEYRPSDEGEVVDLTKRPRQQNPNRGRQPRPQGSQQYYQQMHQQQPFNYQTEGNTWHSNFQQQFVPNPYAAPQGNYMQNQGGYSNQGSSYQQNRGNYQRNYQQRGNYSQDQQNGYPQNQGFLQNQQNQGFPQNHQGNQPYYQGQAPFYQQGGGGYQ